MLESQSTPRAKFGRRRRADLGQALPSLVRLHESDGPLFINQVVSAIFTGGCALPDELDDLRGVERRVERK